MMLNTTEIISVMVGIGGLITALATAVNNRNKTKAEAQNIVADTYGDIINMLRDQCKINAQQITALMEKDVENQKAINGYQQTIERYRLGEKQLIKRVQELESEIEKLKQYNNDKLTATA